MSYFLLLDASLPEVESDPSQLFTGLLLSSDAFPIWIPHFRQQSLLLWRNKPQVRLEEKKGLHWSSSTWLNLLSSILRKDIIPLFINLLYFEEPMVEVFRFEELRFRSKPQEPQLHQKRWSKDQLLQNRTCKQRRIDYATIGIHRWK